MCHLFLLLPVVALPVFWVLPLSESVPSYAAVVAVSIWVYWLAMRAMRRPVITGREELLGGIGEVISAGDEKLRVRVHSEIWNATSKDALAPGDPIRVTGLEKLSLIVSRTQR